MLAQERAPLAREPIGLALAADSPDLVARGIRRLPGVLSGRYNGHKRQTRERDREAA